MLVNWRFILHWITAILFITGELCKSFLDVDIKYGVSRMFLQVSRRIYKGIPEKMRGLVWSLLLGIEQESKKNAGVYEVSYVACLHIKYTFIHMHSYLSH